MTGSISNPKQNKKNGGGFSFLSKNRASQPSPKKVEGSMWGDTFVHDLVKDETMVITNHEELRLYIDSHDFPKAGIRYLIKELRLNGMVEVEV